MVVRVGIAEPWPGSENYRVLLEIEGPEPGRIKRQHMYGVDSWQALMAAMYLAPEILKAVARDAGGTLTFLGDEDLCLVPPPQPSP
jgi:hypothetical protein